MKHVAARVAIVLVALLTFACHRKPPVDAAAANDAIAALNAQLPKQIGVDVTLYKASMVDDDKLVRFDYRSPYPSRVQVPPRATGLMRGSMTQFACTDATARTILDAGFTIDHLVTDADGNQLFDTQADGSVCSIYKD